ncbi:U-box domain-containing protein 4-like isoform X1 [Nicotiana tabacum]|uniref:RING-type E3 ubiquitin transferase n=2 Tax=Nicotiana TaxID=4085 RepID=Q84TU4_TOBAC|nr:U-box domain-containing protein 4-like [Nicotiana tabacum]XP_009797979.1 PREDICTED: U-box domain-containing protein 4-like [Nicotiana sylvestris]XP_009797980.1 PREDICTED: U-box domain-containing protein 4-like [Nicotiana sylvestris]XP_016477834.1 PREDICTED: U-box domain-containing protein 4-like [Nicotiana tabacum]AAO61490.1 arm repeat-containing protein [Nicotiana tabacum]
MEISLLKVLLNNISCFSHLSSSDHISGELVRRYYCKIEDILKLVKPILDAIVDVEAASGELLLKAFAGLAQCVDELRELFETLEPLCSKVYFVLQAEPLIGKIRSCSLEILELLKSSHKSLPADVTLTTLELYILKIKYVDYEMISVTITKVIKAQVEGLGTSSDSFAKIADCLSLNSNQELLIELVALEKLKENAEQAEKSEVVEYIEQMITLVSHMHDCFVTTKQSQSCTAVPIPPDFCCPLSLELMTDPVIVASGQTYERAFIRRWIDLGLTVCPKTRQTLGHTNLIPNYTVKALIANWCEINNVKLPDPMKSLSLNQPSLSPDSTQSSGSPRKSLISSTVSQREESSPSHPRSSSEESLPGVGGNILAFDVERMRIKSEDRMAHSGEISSHGHSTLVADDQFPLGHNRTTSAPSTLSNSNFSPVIPGDGNKLSEDSSVASGDVGLDSKPAASVLPKEPEFPYTPEMRPRNQLIWRRPTERFPRIVSSATVERRADLSEVEEQVKKLIEELKSTSLDMQRNATAELRLLAKHNMDNRMVIANCGAISSLVNLLHSKDMKVQEDAVTALLNLSINDNNKCAIANADAIEPLIHVLQTGSAEAKENSAATLFSLSVMEENKMKIGRSGAIKPLVDLLGNGTPRGKKDAATALFNLSILHENKSRIIQAGAVKYLVELMDPATGMVDKAVAVLSNLATIPEGRAEIGQEGGIPLLVEVVELGSARGKENAAAALLQLCTNSSRFCNMVLQEGAVPPLVALSQSGTPRAREKAQQLLSYFRNQRHGNAGRG